MPDRPLPDRELSVVFVCWGNICRSPIAEQVARSRLADAGLLRRVRVDSAATSTEELGEPLDPRAAAVLEKHGYDPGDHRAHQITAAELVATDLVIAMEPLHVDRLRRIAGPGATLDQVRLLTDFDPDAPPGSGVPDPWYGPDAAFEDTLAAVEAAMPGILAAVRERLGA
ncbi:MAG: low molecular weight protein-tyrosine-phosphatase [Propionibacteriaceae bacterium]